VEIPMMTQVKCLFSDSSYVAMFICASITFGLLGALGNAVSLVVSVWGYKEVRDIFKINHLEFWWNLFSSWNCFWDICFSFLRHIFLTETWIVQKLLDFRNS
jgi:hypothetical protein